VPTAGFDQLVWMSCEWTARGAFSPCTRHGRALCRSIEELLAAHGAAASSQASGSAAVQPAEAVQDRSAKRPRLEHAPPAAPDNRPTEPSSSPTPKRARVFEEENEQAKRMRPLETPKTALIQVRPPTAKDDADAVRGWQREALGRVRELSITGLVVRRAGVVAELARLGAERDDTGVFFLAPIEAAPAKSSKKASKAQDSLFFESSELDSWREGRMVAGRLLLSSAPPSWATGWQLSQEGVVPDPESVEQVGGSTVEETLRRAFDRHHLTGGMRWRVRDSSIPPWLALRESGGRGALRDEISEGSLSQYTSGSLLPSWDAARLDAVQARATESLSQWPAHSAMQPSPTEPARRRTHWDYLLDEMQWLAADFIEERKVKAKRRKNLLIALGRHFRATEARALRKARADEIRRRRRAARLAEEAMRWWKGIDRVVLWRQRARLEAQRQAALDRQLAFLVGQTERYTKLLTSREDRKAPAAGSGGGAREDLESLMHGDSSSDDSDFGEEDAASQDDEATMEEEERGGGVTEHQTEVQGLLNDETVPIEELLKGYDAEAQASNPPSVVASDDDDDDDDEHAVQVPFLLRRGQLLRPYQRSGIDWLVSLHDRRLNGILADEMGLGKTLQTIGLLAHLAAERCIWGPHLIVVPTSTLLNWEQEVKRWCPALKVMTYFGSPKERKAKRAGWGQPNAMHVCITSYNVVVQDSSVFRRRRWYYLVLDEAHYIKNFQSQRWQTLLQFPARRRLLLTGTPLQNSLLELWALLHFLMPHLFRSQQQFKEWFDTPLTEQAQQNQSSAIDRALVGRLHALLRPFVLRRLKSQVAKQLPGKRECVVLCRMSRRQRLLYEDFMARSSTRQSLQSGGYMGMLRVLLSLRKVCNHPDLFETRPVATPFVCAPLRLAIPAACMHPASSTVQVSAIAPGPPPAEVSGSAGPQLGHGPSWAEVWECVGIPTETVRWMGERETSQSFRARQVTVLGEAGDTGLLRAAREGVSLKGLGLLMATASREGAWMCRQVAGQGSVASPLRLSAAAVLQSTLSTLSEVPGTPGAPGLGPDLEARTYAILSAAWRARGDVSEANAARGEAIKALLASDTLLAVRRRELHELLGQYSSKSSLSSARGRGKSKSMEGEEDASVDPDEALAKLDASAQRKISSQLETKLEAAAASTVQGWEGPMSQVADAAARCVLTPAQAALLRPGSALALVFNQGSNWLALPQAMALLTSATSAPLAKAAAPSALMRRATPTSEPEAAPELWASTQTDGVKHQQGWMLALALFHAATRGAAWFERRALAEEMAERSAQRWASDCTCFVPADTVLACWRIAGGMAGYMRQGWRDLFEPEPVEAGTAASRERLVGLSRQLRAEWLEGVSNPLLQPGVWHCPTRCERMVAARRLPAAARQCSEYETMGRLCFRGARWGGEHPALRGPVTDALGIPSFLSEGEDPLVVGVATRLQRALRVMDVFDVQSVKAVGVPVQLETHTITTRVLPRVAAAAGSALLLQHHAELTDKSLRMPGRGLVESDCGKLQALGEVLRERISGGHRCLIFTQMGKMLDVLERWLNLHGWAYLRLDGSTPVPERQRLMDRFNQDDRIPVFILSTRAGGLGINLTGADTVVFYDSDWNPAMDAQAQDRAHRIGQTREVVVYRLVTAGTVEEAILNKARQKKRLVGLSIEAGKFSGDKDDAGGGVIGRRELADILGAAEDQDADEPVTAAALAAAEDEEDAAAGARAAAELADEANEFEGGPAEEGSPVAATEGGAIVAVGVDVPAAPSNGGERKPAKKRKPVASSDESDASDGSDEDQADAEHEDDATRQAAEQAAEAKWDSLLQGEGGEIDVGSEETAFGSTELLAAASKRLEAAERRFESIAAKLSRAERRGIEYRQFVRPHPAVAPGVLEEAARAFEVKEESWKMEQLEAVREEEEAAAEADAELMLLQQVSNEGAEGDASGVQGGVAAASALYRTRLRELQGRRALRLASCEAWEVIERRGKRMGRGWEVEWRWANVDTEEELPAGVWPAPLRQRVEMTRARGGGWASLLRLSAVASRVMGFLPPGGTGNRASVARVCRVWACAARHPSLCLHVLQPTRGSDSLAAGLPRPPVAVWTEADGLDCAIAHALAGETIVVARGVHSLGLGGAPVVVNNAVRIVGAGMRGVDGSEWIRASKEDGWILGHTGRWLSVHDSAAMLNHDRAESDALGGEEALSRLTQQPPRVVPTEGPLRVSLGVLRAGFAVRPDATIKTEGAAPEAVTASAWVTDAEAGVEAATASLRSCRGGAAVVARALMALARARRRLSRASRDSWPAMPSLLGLEPRFSGAGALCSEFSSHGGVGPRSLGRGEGALAWEAPAGSELGQLAALGQVCIGPHSSNVHAVAASVQMLGHVAPLLSSADVDAEDEGTPQVDAVIRARGPLVWSAVGGALAGVSLRGVSSSSKHVVAVRGDGSQLTLFHCDIQATVGGAYGAVVSCESRRGVTDLVHCRVRGGRASGVVSWSGSLVRAVRSSIERCALSGLLSADGAMMLLECRVRGCVGPAIGARPAAMAWGPHPRGGAEEDGGRVTAAEADAAAWEGVVSAVGCDLRGNGGGPVDIGGHVAPASDRGVVYLRGCVCEEPRNVSGEGAVRLWNSRAVDAVRSALAGPRHAAQGLPLRARRSGARRAAASLAQLPSEWVQAMMRVDKRMRGAQ
jgi:superfamily II DNA or RNA helicase